MLSSGELAIDINTAKRKKYEYAVIHANLINFCWLNNWSEIVIFHMLQQFKQPMLIPLAMLKVK